MGLVLGGQGPVVLTGHADASWVDDSATQRSSQGYTFSLAILPPLLVLPTTGTTRRRPPGCHQQQQQQLRQRQQQQQQQPEGSSSSSSRRSAPAPAAAPPPGRRGSTRRRLPLDRHGPTCRRLPLGHRGSTRRRPSWSTPLLFLSPLLSTPLRLTSCSLLQIAPPSIGTHSSAAFAASFKTPSSDPTASLTFSFTVRRLSNRPHPITPAKLLPFPPALAPLLLSLT
ncbi:unnamed protein product [Closterium sp. NIES-54]